jgi:phage shock protein PspC (stress-responsive transcriptional regulator)
MATYKKLERSRTDRMLGGVAGGLASYFDMDSSIVRFLFILGVIVWGTGIWVYVVLWIILPENKRSTEYFSANPQNEPTMEQDDLNFKDAGTYKKEYRETTPNSSDDPYKAYQEKHKRRRENGNLIAGAVLISFGVLFLLSEYIPRVSFSDLWPFVLIVAGGVLLRNYFINNKKQQS